MGYLTESRLANLIDVPVAIPATDLKMGDWLILSSVRVVTPMRINFKFLSLQIIASTVTVSDIDNSNLIFGNLGLAYVALRRDYTSGSPGAAGALDVLVGTDLGVFSRNVNAAIIDATPGVYSWIIANNTQPATNPDAVISTSTSIDFRVSASGMVRVELDYA